MRSFQVFAVMTPEEALRFFGKMKQGAPAIFKQSLHAAAGAMRSRPAFILKQPFEKQVAYARRALARVALNPVADETLATYFLELRKELLIEWLETAKIAHEDGSLVENEPEAPSDEELRAAVAAFRAVDDDEDRELLLRAFASQAAIEWKTLEELIAERLPKAD